MSLKIKTISFFIGLLMIFPVAQPVSAMVGGWLPSIVDSRAFETPALVLGDVVDPSGRPFRIGSSVELVAYPSADVMKSMREGDSIQVTPVAKAFVGPKGGFVLRLDPSVNLERFVSSAGLVDFEVRIVNGGFYAAYSFSESVTSLNELTRNNPTVNSGNPNLKNLHLVSLPVNDKVRLLESSRAGLLNKTDICGEVLLSNLGAKAVAIGATFTGGAGRTGELTYTKGSSSSLGVGLSLSGAFGSYSSSGNVSRSSTSSISFTPAAGGVCIRHIFHTESMVSIATPWVAVTTQRTSMLTRCKRLRSPAAQTPLASQPLLLHQRTVFHSPVVQILSRALPLLVPFQLEQTPRPQLGLICHQEPATPQARRQPSRTRLARLDNSVV